MAKIDLWKKKEKEGGTLPPIRTNKQNEEEKKVTLDQRRESINSRKKELEEIDEAMTFFQRSGIQSDTTRLQYERQQAQLQLSAAEDSYAKDREAGIRGFGNKYTSLFSGSMGYEQIGDIDDLLEEYDGIKGHVDNKDLQVDMDNLREYRDFLSGFENNDEYLAYLEQAEADKALLNFDVDAGQREIDELEAKLKAGERESAEKRENLYPYTDEYNAVEDWFQEEYGWIPGQLEEKKQYLEKAKEYQQWHKNNEYYTSFMNAEDFEEKSKYKTTL